MALFATGKSAQACFAQLYRALGAILLTHFTRVCVGARPLEAGMHHWCLCLLFGDVWVTLEVTHGDSISELVVHMGVFEVLPGTYKYFDACILADSSQLTIPAVVNIFDGVCGAMSGDTYRLLSNNCQHAVLRTLNAMGIQGPLTEETIATVAEFYFRRCRTTFGDLTNGFVRFLRMPVFSQEADTTVPAPADAPFDALPVFSQEADTTVAEPVDAPFDPPPKRRKLLHKENGTEGAAAEEPTNIE